MIQLPYFGLINITLLYICYKRIYTYLHVLQQDDYHSSRFLNWFWNNRAFDRYMTACMFTEMIANHFLGMNYLSSLCCLILIYLARHEKDPIKSGKKPLIMTNRAYRVYAATALLLLLPIVSARSIEALLLTIHIIPLALAGGTILCEPLENHFQKRFIKSAKHKLNKLKPIVIGVTGSYGKTSFKKILGHILRKYHPTLTTPASVNTPMGICKVINNSLNATYKYFVVEMGAYQKGSISKLCQLTQPRFGVVTSIGPCHLERFGSIENIVSAKSELISSVEAHPKTMGFTFPKNINQYPTFSNMSKSKHMIQPIECIHKEQSVNGISMRIRYQEEDIDLHAPIYGLHQADNIALATTVALHLGMPVEQIKSALKSLPQMPARLEVKEDFRDITWINDGYNANPEGFKQGVHLLNQFGEHKSGRKILVTPGVIELGKEHDQVHETLAEETMKHVDIVIAVTHQRIKSFVATCELFKKESQRVIKVLSFKEAQRWLDEHMQPKDTILIANDLPDILEARPNI